MAAAFSTLGSPIGYSQTWGTTPYGTQGFGVSPWQQQMPQQLLQFLPQQLQQIQYVQLQQQQVLQQLQQLLQVIPQQLQQLQQHLQSQQAPFGQTAAGIGAGFGTPFFGTPVFGPQSFPSQVM